MRGLWRSSSRGAVRQSDSGLFPFRFIIVHGIDGISGSFSSSREFFTDDSIIEKLPSRDFNVAHCSRSYCCSRDVGSHSHITGEIGLFERWQKNAFWCRKLAKSSKCRGALLSETISAPPPVYARC